MADKTSRFPATVQSARLTMRLARPSDGSALQAALIRTMPQLSPWFQWADVLERFGSPEDLAARAALAAKRFETGGGPTYYLWDDTDIVGEISFNAEGFDYGVLTFAVWVRSDRGRTGFGTEAGRALCDAMFDCGTEFIEAGCHSYNFRSRRLLTKLGFRPHGMLKDLERYLLMDRRRRG